MKKWADFYDYVIPALPGVETDLVTFHVRNAAIEFCEETGIADFQASQVSLVEGQDEYSVMLHGADYTVARIKSAYLDEKYLVPTTPDQLDRSRANWSEHKGSPVMYFMPDPTVLKLYPTPDKSGQVLKLVYTLMPTRDSVGVEDFLFERYVEDIAHGAISRLAMMPAKPWTNLETAANSGLMFRAAKRDAAIEINKGFTRSQLKVSMRRIV